MPDTPSVPLPAEAALRARVAELEAANAALREAAAARDELAAAQLAARDAQLAVLVARVGELERRLGKDSSTSSKPPSSDSPYKKKSRDRSLRGRSGRAPGKQPGAPSSTLRQSADPGEIAECGPVACGCCGADLAGAEVTGVQKRQVLEASPPPPPKVIEYQVQAKTCGNCGAVSIGVAPAHVTGRVQYGPGVHARAALAVCGHYLPAVRAAALVASLAGVKVSAGFTAGVRGKAAALLGPFMDRVRVLLHEAGGLYADETPARTAGKLYYVHVACTEFLTPAAGPLRTSTPAASSLATPGRSSATATPDTATSPTRCMHGAGLMACATCAASTSPTRTGKVWARSMADLLICANAKATAARAAGKPRLGDADLTEIGSWYRGAVAKGITDNQNRRGRAGKDGLRLARRFRDHQDMILRFTTDLAVGFTSNQAERDIRPVKVQMRTSGGCWRTLEGLADFAVVQSYLSTATKWGIGQLDALTQLFTDGPWLPNAIRPG